MPLSLEQETALSNALYELNRNYEAAWDAVHSIVWFDGDGRDNAGESLDGSKAALELLRGPLLEAARGLRPWPLDEAGATINVDGALDAWARLAESVRGALEGIKGYVANWSSLELLSKTGKSIAQGAGVGLGGVAALVALLIVLEVVRK